MNRQPAQHATHEQARGEEETGEQATGESISTLTRFKSHQAMLNL